jgi:hypothetical protein
MTNPTPETLEMTEKVKQRIIEMAATFIFDQDQLTLIDNWIADQSAAPALDRNEAIRHLVDLGLRAPKPKKGPDQTMKDSDGRIIPPAGGLKAKGK